MIPEFIGRAIAELLVRVLEADRARRVLEERLAVQAARARADARAREKFRDF